MEPFQFGIRKNHKTLLMKLIPIVICFIVVLTSSAQQMHSTNQPAFVYKGDTANRTYYFPEFYYRDTKRHKDTTWKFECYDSRDSIMSIDTVGNIREVRYFSIFKSFTDSAHTYKDSLGKKQLLPVSSIIQRYDRLGRDKWLSVDYSRNKYTELKEYPSEIVKTDTLIIYDPFNGKEHTTYYKYYKVVTQK
jgi:hypothetical protein